MKKLILFLFLLLPITAFGQYTVNNSLRYPTFASDPPCVYKGRTWLNTTSNVVKYCDNNLSVQTLGAGGSSLTGSGTTNTIAKWSGTMGLTGSNAADDGQTYSVNQPAQTGSAANTGFQVNSTLNTTGTPDILQINLTDTASGGTTNFINAKVSGSTVFRVQKNGSIVSSASITSGTGLTSTTTIRAGSSSSIGFTSRSILTSSADGKFELKTSNGATNAEIAAVGNITSSGDIIIASAAKGVIQCDSNGIAWRQTINTSGADVKTSLGAQGYCLP